ncbi:MAG: hypothetical protein WBD01_02530 [Salaquimonas sp.]
MFKTEKARNVVVILSVTGSLALGGCTSSSSSNTSLDSPANATLASSEKPTGAAYVDPLVNFDNVKDIDGIRADDVIRRSKGKVRRTGEIYLMRGLADVFSRGIDRMARDLRGRGYDAPNFSYQYWEGVARDIVARAKRGKVSYPVVIVGHSLGGNESSKFANYLAARDVKVSLVVAFDPVETGYVGPGIGEVINYYLPKKRTDNRILAKEGFTGKIENIDVTADEAITHTNVEKNVGFQSATYALIAGMTKRQSSRQIANSADKYQSQR